MIVRSLRSIPCKNRDEQSDAPKSASGAFFQWRDHRADSVIRSVRRLNNMDMRIQHILALGNPGRETDRARNCISLAIQCADELGEHEFDSCHLLSGLYREGNGVAFHVLKNFDVSQRQIDDALRSRDRSTADEFQINRDMKVVLDAAFAAARGMSHNYIGTEHLLIGATSETVGAAKMLTGFGIPPNDVQNEVYNLLGHGRE